MDAKNQTEESKQRPTEIVDKSWDMNQTYRFTNSVEIERVKLEVYGSFSHCIYLGENFLATATNRGYFLVFDCKPDKTRLILVIQLAKDIPANDMSVSPNSILGEGFYNILLSFNGRYSIFFYLDLRHRTQIELKPLGEMIYSDETRSPKCHLKRDKATYLIVITAANYLVNMERFLFKPASMNGNLYRLFDRVRPELCSKHLYSNLMENDSGILAASLNIKYWLIFFRTTSVVWCQPCVLDKTFKTEQLDPKPDFFVFLKTFVSRSLPYDSILFSEDYSTVFIFGHKEDYRSIDGEKKNPLYIYRRSLILDNSNDQPLINETNLESNDFQCFELEYLYKSICILGENFALAIHADKLYLLSNKDYSIVKFWSIEELISKDYYIDIRPNSKFAYIKLKSENNILSLVILIYDAFRMIKLDLNHFVIDFINSVIKSSTI